MKKDVEGNGLSLTDVLSQHFPEGIDENNESPRSG
jgi:hypothetical protein